MDKALESRRKLMEVALGNEAPDLAITGAKVFNAWTGEILENASVLVSGERIAHVGQDEPQDWGEQTQVLNARGMTLIPGFVDSHTHLAWLATPGEYARFLAALGTTCLITETMEIYPVAGKEGIREWLASLDHLPLRTYITLPAMATINPSSLGLNLDDLEELAGHEKVVGLGESYWQTVFQEPDLFLPVFEKMKKAGKCLEGHSAGAKGRKLSAYAALGIGSCHEAITQEQALEKLRAGIHVQIREGSIRSDLAAIAPIARTGIDLSNISLVSDGVTPGDLLAKGHMNGIVQKAIDLGIPPADAVRMASLNPARHFGLDQDIGSIAPGRFADMILIPDMHTIQPQEVIYGGKIIQPGENPAIPAFRFSPQARNRVILPNAPLSPEAFQVKAPDDRSRVPVNTIQFITDLVTKPQIMDLEVQEGWVQPDPEKDVLKVAVIDRALHPGKLFTGFVAGFGIQRGALATSAAWDGSEILAIGENDQDLALAINQIAQDQGGIVLAVDGRIARAVSLPIFGLMSGISMEEMARKIEALTRDIQSLGCPFPDPLLSLSTLTGAAIPYLRISSRGLVDLKTGKPQALFPDQT